MDSHCHLLGREFYYRYEGVVGCVVVGGPEDDGAGDGTSFILTVTPVNDAPVVDALEDASIAEDTEYTV